MSTRWNRKVTEHLDERQSYPNFAEFVKFLQKEARIACNPITSLGVLKEISGLRSKGANPRVTKTTALSTSIENPGSEAQKETKTPDSRVCLYCQQTHFIINCNLFEKCSQEEKRLFVMKNKLCFGCLRVGHHSKDCQKRHTCKKCSRRHPTVLHNEQAKQQEKPDQSPGTTSSKKEDEIHKAVSFKVDNGASSGRTTMIVPVWLSTVDEKDKEVLTYAILDNQSDASFISEDLAARVGVKSVSVRLSIKTVTSPLAVSESSNLIQSLRVCGMRLEKTITLPKIYTRRQIPCKMSQIPTGEMAEISCEENP